MKHLGLKILHLESDVTDLELVKNELFKAKMRFEKRDVTNADEYATVLNSFEPDVILANYRLESLSCLEALKISNDAGLKIPFILITEPTSEEFAVSAMKEGVADYILKDRMQRLPAAIFNAVKRTRLELEKLHHMNDVITSEALLREAESVAHIGSLHIDFLLQTRAWSSGVDQILGYQPGEVANTLETFVSCVHPEDKQGLLAHVNEAIAGLEAVDYEFRVITPTGLEKHVQSKIIIIRDRLGRAIRGNGFIQDITERKNAEIKLKQTSFELNKLFNTIDEVFFSRDMINSKLIQISPGCEKMYGYKPEEFLNDGGLWSRIMHHDNIDIQKNNDNRFANGETVITQYKVFHKNKGVRWAESKVIPTLDNTGKLIRIDGVTRDITESKKLQLELLQNEDRLRALMGNSSDIITVINEDGAIVYNSENIKKILGYPQALFLGKQFDDELIHPDDFAHHQYLFSESKHHPGHTYSFTWRVRNVDDRWVWVEGTLTNLLQVPAVNGIVANYRDISERKTADDLIQKHSVRLQEVLNRQNAIIDALPPHIALLDENGTIVTVNESWKKFAVENELATANYGVGSSYIQVSEKNPGMSEVDGFEAYQGIQDVIAGVKMAFSMEYPCHAPFEKRWFQLLVAPLKNDKHKGAVVVHVNISDQKLAKEKLLLSEERYRTIVETAQEGIWVINNEMETIFINQKMCEMLGYSADEIMGKHNYDFKEEREKLNTINRITKKKPGVIETHESTFVTKSGKQLICIVTTNGIFDEGGTYIGTLAMLTDITKRKAQEDALKQSEANLLAIVENTTDLVYSLNKDLRFITFNEIFKNTIKHVYGLDVKKGAKSLDLLGSLNPETAEKWSEIYAKALSGETLQFVNEYPGENAPVYLSYSVNPIWESGKVIGLSCFSRDITKQKSYEVALINSEANLRSVFENTDLSIILYNTELEIVAFNSNANKTTIKNFGKELELGKTAYAYFPENRWDTVKQAIKRVKNGETVEYEAIHDEVNGGKNWFETKWAGVLDDNNDIVNIILTFKPITENKRAELERQKMTDDLVRRNQELEQFTYIISHNLRAPVANIKGLSGLLEDVAPSEQDYFETLHSLQVSVDHLDKVIVDLNQILETTRQVNEKRERINMSYLIAEIKLEIKTMLDKNNVVLNCDFDPEEIFTVKSYLHSVFQNLIVNSIKYRRADVDPLIQIKSWRGGDKVYLSFEDNGKGIDLKSFGEHLFGLYKRFDFSVEGKGMGLFMVKKEVESLGGKISVQSEAGKGTTFLVELPIDQ